MFPTVLLLQSDRAFMSAQNKLLDSAVKIPESQELYEEMTGMSNPMYIDGAGPSGLATPVSVTLATVSLQSPPLGQVATAVATIEAQRKSVSGSDVVSGSAVEMA